MGRESFVFYRSFAEQLRKLPAEQYKRIMNSIFDYALDGVVNDMDTIDGIIFGLIKPQLDANNQRYQNGCKGAEFGKLGGRPKKPQENPTETPKKPQENPTETPNDNVNDNVNVNDNENENVNDIKKSTSVLKEKGRSDEHQKLFFEKYPLVVIDNYSTADYADMDFELLILEFEQSKFLQGRKSFKWICSNYRAIVAGHYRDFVDSTDNASKKKPLYATPTVYSCED